MGRKRKRSKEKDLDDGKKVPTQIHSKGKKMGRKDEGSGHKVPPAIQAYVNDEDVAVVLPLPFFVAKLCPNLPKIKLNENCTDSKRIFSTWVVSNEPLVEQPLSEPTVSESLKDLIDHVVYTIVQRRGSNWSQRNVLGQGHQSLSNSIKARACPTVRECPNMKPGVICFRVNDNVNFLQVSSYAKMLHKLIGDKLFRLLLLQTCIFLPLIGNSNNFILLCGEHSCGQSKRRRKYEEGGNSHESWNPNHCLTRYSLFYSNAYLPKVGLPTNHILNQENANKLLNSIAPANKQKFLPAIAVTKPPLFS